MSTTPSVTAGGREPAFASVAPHGPRVRELNHPPPPTSYISNQSYDDQLSLSGFPAFPLGPAYYDISTSILPKAPFIKEELEENH